MTTLDYTLINNLMAGLTLRMIEEKFPCFSNLSNADFENLDDTITVTITCRKEDAHSIEKYLEPFMPTN